MKLIDKVKRYFKFIGISHKFAPGELFADVDLTARIDEFEVKVHAPSEGEQEDKKELLKAIEEWDGEFETLYQAEHALRDLCKEILPKKNLAQSVHIDQWNRFCELKNWPEKKIPDDGECAGLSLGSSIGLFPNQLNQRRCKFVHGQYDNNRKQ